MHGFRVRHLLVSLSLLVFLGASDAYAAWDRWAAAGTDILQVESTYNVIPKSRSQADKAPARPRATKAAAGGLQQLVGDNFELSGTTLFVFLLLVFPVCVIMVYLTGKVTGEGDEGLGGRSFGAAFFHRLMFSVAFWVVVITDLYKASPTGDMGTVFLTDLAVAAMAIGWWFPNSFARVMLVSLVFCVFDMLGLSAAFLASTLLFS